MVTAGFGVNSVTHPSPPIIYRRVDPVIVGVKYNNNSFVVCFEHLTRVRLGTGNNSRRHCLTLKTLKTRL